MATASVKSSFTGPFAKELEELSEFIDWLWNKHGMSFVKAGDDRVYAFGGNNCTLVMDESKWDGLIEFITPGGAITIKPAEDGTHQVAGANLDEAAIKKTIADGIASLKAYYEKRYWQVPKGTS